MKALYKAGDLLGSLKIEKGDVAESLLNAAQNYSVLMRKGAKSTDIRHELIVAKELKAPVKAGQSVGKLVVYQGNEVIKEFDIQAPQDVNKAGWWKLFKRTTSNLFD